MNDRAFLYEDDDGGPRTAAGIPVREYYGAEAPGRPPFTRGIRAGMYRERPWAVRQLAGFATPEATNERTRWLLDNGATAVNTVFDFPTNRGYDSDDPLASNDVGLGGVAVDCVDDLLLLYRDVPLDEVSVSLVLSHPVAAGAVLAMYLAAAERRGYRPADLRGTLQNDFLMETVVLTTPSVLEPAFAFRLSMDVVEYCTGHLPRWNPISYTGYNYSEAGADAVHEAALVLAHARETCREMGRRGHEADAYAGRLTAFFSAGNDFFEEIAKYRAARRLYDELMRKAGVRGDRNAMLRYHVQTAGSSLTAQQPLNNITRAAYQALAAVLGGAQSLHVSAYDEALSIPAEAAALVATNTQHILRHETGVTRTADPLGGSHYVEHLTDEVERRIRAVLDEIDARGGLVAAVQDGWVHERVYQQAYQRELAISEGRHTVVGANRFQVAALPAAMAVDPFAAPPALASRKEALARHRAERDESEVARALRDLK
ncbi:methylmalonyl-CoA mutase family protein, partial [Kitasatospora phosalacinea]|uniref:methylmalonyl-CoA mutase family protein n=1 Tax=Kitasatospora phosalacinea TaxID=2065 RepID=UPI0036667D34